MSRTRPRRHHALFRYAPSHLEPPAACRRTATNAHTAKWLRQHPEIEIVSRDRCGLYAQGARDGAPQAKQVADRFHLLQNLREAIEHQMTNLGQFAGRSLLPAEAGELNPAPRQARRETRKSAFDRVQTLHLAGKSSRHIAERTGIGWSAVVKWIRSGCLPDRRQATLTPSSPSYFQDFLLRQWEAGNRLRDRKTIASLRTDRPCNGCWYHFWPRAQARQFSSPIETRQIRRG